MKITQLELAFCKDLYKDIDTQKLAKNLGIHKSTLYDIDSGRRKMSDELFNKLIKYFNIVYNHEEKLYDEAYNMLVNMFEYFISYQSDKIFELYKKYNEKRDVYSHSKAFIYVNLFEAIYYTEIDNNEKVEELLKLSKQYLDF